MENPHNTPLAPVGEEIVVEELTVEELKEQIKNLQEELVEQKRHTKKIDDLAWEVLEDKKRLEVENKILKEQNRGFWFLSLFRKNRLLRRLFKAEGKIYKLEKAEKEKSEKIYKLEKEKNERDRKIINLESEIEKICKELKKEKSFWGEWCFWGEKDVFLKGKGDRENDHRYLRAYSEERKQKMYILALKSYDKDTKEALFEEYEGRWIDGENWVDLGDGVRRKKAWIFEHCLVNDGHQFVRYIYNNYKEELEKKGSYFLNFNLV